jgi:hypothetical protein
MFWQRLFVALAVVIVATASGGTIANAAGPASQVIELQRYKDPHTGQTIRILVNKDVRATGIVVALSGCNYREASIWATGSGGNTLWRLTQRADWCWNDVAVTSYGRTITTYIDQSTYWKDLGSWSDSVTSPQTGAWQTVAYRQQHFAQCAYFPPPVNWFCWGDSYPWLRTYVYGNGTSYVEAGT